MHALFRLILVWLLVAAAAVFCSGCGGGRPAAEKQDTDNEYLRLADEYRLLLIMNDLAQLKEPYLVIDFERNRLELRLEGATVWHAHMEYIATDSADIQAFRSEFLSKKNLYVRRMTGKHLYSADDKTPDSILAIVARAIEVDPETLQRVVPERFRLYWGGGLYLEIQTEISGKTLSRFKNMLTDLGDIVHAPFHSISIRLKMAPDDALTLYRVSNLGMFTFLYTRARSLGLSGNTL